MVVPTVLQKTSIVDLYQKNLSAQYRHLSKVSQR